MRSTYHYIILTLSISFSNQDRRPLKQPHRRQIDNTAYSVFGGNTKFQAYDQAIYDAYSGGPAESVQDLRCGFDTSCCWINSERDTLDWFVGSGSIDGEQFLHRVVHKERDASKPDGSFLVVMSKRSSNAEANAIFRSCSFCTSGKKLKVTFRHWTSALVELKVCWRDAFFGDENAQMEDCRTIGAEDAPGPTTVELTVPRDTVAEVQFIVTGFTDGGVAVLDDVTVDATICGQEEATTTTTTTLAPRIPTVLLNPLDRSNKGEAVPKSTTCLTSPAACNFENNTLCGYKNSNNASFTFDIVKGRSANRVTGVYEAPQGTHYVMARVGPGMRATLEAPSSLERTEFGAAVMFQVYEATNGLRLKACCQTRRDNICPFVTNVGVALADRQWKNVTLNCPKETEKVIFVCENFASSYGVCGLDNIRVLEIFRSGSAENINPLCSELTG